jgi:hypothetical protein
VNFFLQPGERGGEPIEYGHVGSVAAGVRDHEVLAAFWPVNLSTDELRLIVHPLVLRSGRRLLGDGAIGRH